MQKFKGLLGLRARMLLFGAAALLPVLALIAYLSWLNTQEMIGRERIRAGNLASLIARDQVLPFGLSKQMLQSLVLVPAVANPNDKAACHRVLDKAVGMSSFLTGIVLFSADGEAICASSESLPPPTSGNAYFKEVVETKRMVVSDFFVGKITGKSIVVMALPLLDEQGRIRSVLTAGLSLGWMDRSLAEVPVPPGTNIVLVDSHGTVLTPERWLGKSVAEHPVFKRVAGITTETTFEAQGIDGIERIFVAKPLNPALGGQTYLWVAVPTVSTSSAALHEFLDRTALIFVTVLILIVAIWGVGSRLVLRPVEVLRDAAMRLGKSQMSIRTNLPHTDDEIGQLATTFDDMASSIEARESELSRSRYSLLRANRALRVLSTVNHTIINAESEQALLAEMCHVATFAGGYNAVWVGRKEDDLDKSIVGLAWDGLPDDLVKDVKVSWGDNVHGLGAAGSAVRENRPVIIRDALSDPRYAPWRELAAKGRVESVIGLPVRVEGCVWGAIVLYSTEPGFFDKEEALLLQEVADDLGLGIGLLRNREKRRAAEISQARANRALRVLSAVNQAIIRTTEEQELFDEMCRLVVTEGGYHSAIVARAENDQQKTLVELASKGVPEEYRGKLKALWADTERGRGPAGTAVRENRPVVMRNLMTHPGFALWHSAALKEGLQEGVGLPVRVDGSVWGVIALYSTQDDVFDEEETRLLQQMSDDLGFGIQTLRLQKLRDEADKALREANERLEQRVLERTAALKEANRELEAFSYSVSHDLRAPLRSMDGFAKMLDEDYSPVLDSKGKDFLARIRRAAQRMAVLIDDLLELARISKVEMIVKDVSLSVLASEIATELTSAEPDRRVQLKITPNLTARGDLGLLRVLLQNLIQNAWKYTGKCAEPQIEFGLSEVPSAERAFYVRDNGAGFDMAHAERLFKPFSRLHSAEEFAGTGIGLATVARIVSRHGGHIWAQSETGKGATFYFTLPR